MLVVGGGGVIATLHGFKSPKNTNDQDKMFKKYKIMSLKEPVTIDWESLTEDSARSVALFLFMFLILCNCKKSLTEEMKMVYTVLYSILYI